MPQQNEFGLIILPYIACFACYTWLSSKSPSITTKKILALAIVARCILFFAFPNLSDDIYRFVWDGRLAHLGINPMTVLPSKVVGIDPNLSDALFGQLNSPEYFTVYPPFSQWVFYASTFIPTDGLRAELLIMRGIILLFELFSLYGIIKLLKFLGQDSSLVSWYGLNPLVIIEVTGNLHFEGVMICFMIWGLYFLFRSNMLASGLFWGLSILTKLLPLMFMPLIWFSQKRSSVLRFGMLTMIVLLLGFGPYLIYSVNAGTGFTDSLDLYMRKFEFNASIYYLLRGLGYGIYGYNLIHILGPVLAMVVMSAIIYTAYRYGKNSERHRVILLMFFSFCIFLFGSMTVHPWYLCVPIALSCFVKFRFAIVWSFLIFLTYINYSYTPYFENLWIVATEYLIVICVLLWEVNKYGWFPERDISQ